MTPSNATPLHTLFLSTTRPPTTTTTGGGPPSYKILLQSTYSYADRITAATPNHPSKDLQCIKNGCCDVIWLECWTEIVQLCEGRMVWINALNSISVKNSVEPHVWELFQENGRMIDLYSNPFGWDEDSDEEETKANTNVTTQTANLTSLESIYQVIEDACSNLHQSSTSNKPIPILFDSLTPLLLHHGHATLQLFLSTLSQISTSSYTASPILLPLSTTVSLDTVRMLEDDADAVLTLVDGRLEIAKRSARMGGSIDGLSGVRLMKDVQYFDVVVGDGGIRLWTKGEGQGGRDATRKENENRSPKQDSSTSMEVLDRTNERKESKRSGTSQGRGGVTLQHEGEEGRVLPPAVQSTKPTPRIFMEENDPEFQDLDEEDPDDDLDI